MKTKANKPAKSNIAKMAIVGVLSAIAYLLMFMEFSVPLMPVFIKMDRVCRHEVIIYRINDKIVRYHTDQSH